MKLLSLLLCLLLCGCARDTTKPQIENPTIPPATVAETQPVILWETEPSRQGTLTVYPLRLRKVREVCAMGNDLLVLAGRGNTTLARLTGEPLTAAASIELDFELAAGDIQIREDHVSFYDPEHRLLRILDRELREIHRIPITEPVQGSPVLTADGNTIFYCTNSALLAWDLCSGIHRTVKELSYDSQELIGLHLDGTVLQCRIRDGSTLRSLFLAADTGQQLSLQEGDVTLETLDRYYYASVPVGSLALPVFGQAGGIPQAVYPEDTAADCFFLPQKHAAVTASLDASDCPRLRYYNLTSGTLGAELALEPLQMPKSIVSDEKGNIWFLIYDPTADQDQLCCWNVSAEAFRAELDSTYVGIYSGANSQAPETLNQCQELAASLSDKYDITILIGEDAAEIQPWDYRFEPETLPQVLSAELKLLDQRLGEYPEVVLRKTAACFPSLTISLVRSITGTTESTRSLDSATGIQFLDDTGAAYVAIAVGKYSQQALYHELFHVMETRILNESTALDLWNSLNPPEFFYTFGFTEPEQAEQYLSGKNRAFIDGYSMTYPKEDRARVWEAAMLPGNAELFESEIMQRKLTALCKGVREAYGLKKSEETFLWEQYLQYPVIF